MRAIGSELEVNWGEEEIRPGVCAIGYNVGNNVEGVRKDWGESDRWRLEGAN